MAKNLDTLKQKRLKWVEANRENGFDEGINRLLTELYPDNAHFIYELLQNAEDPKATEVTFKLTNSAVEFEHNGERLFTLKDVESITSIGNSTKRDDPTSIGKFGVGFKAVFAYTTEPEIHSGDFHFHIHDLVVPEYAPKPSSPSRKTQFIFPLNNPKKPTAIAVGEIEAGLRGLGDNCLLFLNHIRRIDYRLPDDSWGSLRRIDHNNGRIEIRAQHPGDIETISHWLHFQKEVEITDDDGALKTCTIAIAYNLVKEENKKTKQEVWRIETLSHGQVSIYFPAEKETSNLRFHIHAPFASTVARDSVRDCMANHQLRDCIAELVVESLSTIREQGMLTINFLAVLPNPSDNLAGNAPFYEPIRKAIVEAFKKKALTPTRSGKYAPALTLYRGPARIMEVLSDQDLSLLINSKTPVWSANPQQQNQREDKFLDSLQIKLWGWNELTKLFSNFDNDKKNVIENWLKPKPDKWLMSFYALLGEACSSSSYMHTISIGNLKIIKVTAKQGDEFVLPSQAYFPSTEGITVPSDILIVKDSVYAISRSDEQKRLSRLFLEKSGVLPFDTKQVISLKLAEYEKQPDQLPAEYWDDIKMFVQYWYKNPISNTEIFKDRTFLRGKSKDGKIKWCNPRELYIDKPFTDTGLRDLFNQEAFKLEKYKCEILEEYHSIPHFAEFAIAIDVMDRLEIAEYLATKMQKDFHVVSRKTDTTIDKDYFINCLSGGWKRQGSRNYIGTLPFPSNNKVISYAIWQTLCKAEPEQFVARYRPNQTNQHLEKSSSAYFIKQLTHNAWIPDRDGKFLKPADMTEEALHPDFSYDDQNGWLTAIGFGTSQSQLEIEKLKKDLTAAIEGFPSHEIKMQCVELIKAGFDPRTFLQKHRQIEFPEISVPNPERRQKGVLERSANAPSKESITRERSIQPGITSVIAEAKAYLRAKYTNANGEMVCQCCQNEMPFKIGSDYYFEAVQCVKNGKNHYIENRLALCPLCSAMYQYARQTDDEDIKKSLINNSSSNDAPFVEIPINLAEKEYQLRFVGPHWFDLKIILLNLNSKEKSLMI